MPALLTRMYFVVPSMLASKELMNERSDFARQSWIIHIRFSIVWHSIRDHYQLLITFETKVARWNRNDSVTAFKSVHL